MDALHNKGDALLLNSCIFPRIKEEEDDSCTDVSGQDLSAQSDVFDQIKTEDSCNSYGSVKEDPRSNTQGDFVYNPDTLLWIKRVSDAELTTDDDSEVKEPQVDAPSLKSGATGGTMVGEREVKRRLRPRFTAAEEFVLVTEMLEHYDKLFGQRARITPFAQKVSVWQKVLDNINSVGVMQRGIEEAKKHWHLYKHRLMEKLMAIRKQGSGTAPGHPLLLHMTPLESKVADLFKLEYMFASLPHPSMTQHGLRSHDSVDMAGGQRGPLYVQNGGGAEQGVISFAHIDYGHSKAPRNIKFSFDENCALVHEAVGVWESIVGRNAANTSQARKNFLWSRIVEAVNAAGSQPRSIENCKKRLRDIKRRVKAKMADQRKYSQRHGGGPSLELQYLSYEEELMHIMGNDPVRPIDGHVDTDREPRPINHPPAGLMGVSSFSGGAHRREGKSEPEEDNYDEEESHHDFWNQSSFDLGEEEDEDDKEPVIKMEPINYSTDVLPTMPPFPVAVQSVPISTQPGIISQIPLVSTRPLMVNAKPPSIVSKPLPIVTKPLPTTNKTPSLVTKPPPATPQPAGAMNSPGPQQSAATAGNINKVVGSFHSAQRHYHRSQRHQMHVLHMDLLHLGTGLQQLTRNVKVNNCIRATARARKFRLKQKDIEERRQFRAEKLRLLKEHHEAKQRLLHQHHEKKERLMFENNQILQGILQRLSDSTGAPSTTTSGEWAPTVTTSTDHNPSPPSQNTSDSLLVHKGARSRGGKGGGGA